jgi:hypothetical protein
MTIVLTNFIRGSNLKASDFTFNEGAKTISITTSAGSSVKAAIDAAIAAMPTDKYVNGLQSYNETTNVLTLTMSDGTTVGINMTALVADAVASVGMSSETSAGIAEVATTAEVTAGTDDTRLVTPLKLAAYVANAITGATPDATSTIKGKVSLAVASEVGSTSDVEAATPAYVTAAITAATPGFVNDVIATIPNATDTVKGIVSLATASNQPSTSDVEAATPAYVTAAIAAALATLTDPFGN